MAAVHVALFAAAGGAVSCSRYRSCLGDLPAAQCFVALFRHVCIQEGGRHLRVDSAAQQPQYDATRSVFVGNLPFVVDVRTLLLVVPPVTVPRLFDKPGQASAA